MTENPLRNGLNGAIPAQDWEFLRGAVRGPSFVFTRSMPHPYAPDEEGLRAPFARIKAPSGVTYAVVKLSESEHEVYGVD